MVRMEQQCKEWRLLIELTKLINEEPSFINQIQKYFDKDKTPEEILREMNETFGE